MTLDDRLADFARQHPEVSVLTLAAANLLLSSGLRPPDEIARGYWPRVSLVWVTAGAEALELEVGETDYVYYGEGMDIRHFGHLNATSVPQDLLALLPATGS